MKILSAFNETTAKDFQLGAGILVTGLTDIENFNGTVSKPAKTIGVSSGGWKFTATPEFWNLYEGVDGVVGDMKGGKQYANWEVKLTGSTKAINYENMKMALRSTTTPDGTNYKKFSVDINITDEHYLPNVCWIGTHAGSDKPLIIEIKNVLNTTGLSITAEDKATGTIEFELVGHFDPAKPHEVPFNIYYPADAPGAPGGE